MRGSADTTGPSEQERKLLALARGGDRDAFRELVESHQDRVFRLAIRVLGCDQDRAADLAQEVFLRMFRGLASFDGRARLSTWLHKITMNLCISEYRKARASKRSRWTFSLDAPAPGTDDLFFEPKATGAGPADRAQHEEIAKAVKRAVSELPEEFKSAVVLRDLQGLGYEEIGEILSIPVGTVRSRIHRGRLLLQRKLRGFRP